MRDTTYIIAAIVLVCCHVNYTIVAYKISA